jgi:tetratricopeptide (TPR) repeat protein
MSSGSKQHTNKVAEAHPNKVVATDIKTPLQNVETETKPAAAVQAAHAKIFKPDFSEIDRSEIDDDKTEKHFREVKKEIHTQMQKQNFNEALALSKQALELANQLKKPPDVVAAMQWRVGQAYYRMENYPAAAREFKATLKTVANQNDVDSLRCKFQALMGCGRVAYYNRELANASTYFNAAYNSIEARKQDPQLPQAEKDAVVKHKSVCMFYLGEVNEEMNNFEKAVKYYKASLQFNPNNSRARERLRASQLKLGGLSAPNAQLEKVSPRSDDSEI